MSRIGNLPITIPSGVTISISGHELTVKGAKGELKFTHHPDIGVSVEGDKVIFARQNDEKTNRCLHGTMRSIVDNMITGVTKGFEERLEVRGVGYRFNISGKKLNLALGFSHPIDFPIPDGITISTDEENKNLMIIQGVDKQLVGETAALIRSFRKPEPYKGKGIRYVNERVIIKQGKKAAK
ncbi:MAG: 50S ribosomal protein L6 [bacterium]|nr:50S ribosomal protein L6 [bacterium]